MTYTKEEARIKIQKLVEDFHAHEATLEKAAEAQIENNFIRPLFRYLNWNTENEGLSHAHYEFKVQVTNKKGLRPDYILSLDGRDVLVMDAKQDMRGVERQIRAVAARESIDELVHELP